MTARSVSSSWATERVHWHSFYVNTLKNQIDRLVSRISTNKTKHETLIPHFESMLVIFERGTLHPDPATRLRLLDFVRTLHPLPIWWGKWTAWMRILEKAINIAQSEGKRHHQMWLQLRQAEMLLSTGNGEKAFTLSESAYQVAQEENEHEMAFRAEILMFDTKKYLGHIQNPLHDLKALECSLAWTKQHVPQKTAQELEIHFSLKKSDILQRQGYFQNALEASRNALQRSKKTFQKTDYVMAHIHSRLGGSYWAKNDHENAIKHLEQSKEIFQLWGDQASQIDAMGDIGLIHWRATQYYKAEQVLKKSLNMAEEINAWRWQTIQTGDLGLVYFSQGKLSKAVELMDQHYSLAVQTDNHTEAERANGNRAIACLYMGNFKEAHSRFLRSLDSVESKNLTVAIGVVRVEIGWTLEGLGRESDALKHTKNTLSYAETTESPELLILALRALSETINHREKGIHYAKKALEMAREHKRQFNEAGALLTLAHYRTFAHFLNKKADWGAGSTRRNEMH